MKQYLINKNSDELLLFFTGMGCDEYEFEHLESKCDVLLLYDYSDLNFNFDFSKYKKIDLIAFSAGVFVASIFDFSSFKINKIDKKIAIAGNPYLFDEHFGLSKKIQELLFNINENNADEFARNYLIKTDEEWEKFHPSKRTIESCKIELNSLKELYKTNKQNIKDIYNEAIFGEDEPLLNISAQKEFYQNRLHYIKNARHSIFFKIKNYEQILNFNFSDYL